MPRHTAIKGWTLIELLITAAIFSIIILSLYSAFHTGILSYQKIDATANTCQQARIVFNRLELDLKNSFAYGQGDAKFNGTASGLVFFTILDCYGKGGKVSTDICKVKYELADGVLKRSCYKGQEALALDTGHLTQESLLNIQDSSFFSYGYRTVDNPQEPYAWQELWPREGDSGQEQKKNLPLAVKLELVLKEEGAIRRDNASGARQEVKLTKVVYLPSY